MTHHKHHILYGRFVSGSETPALVKFLLRTGLVRTETQAVYILMLVAAVSAALALYILSGVYKFSLNGTPRYNVPGYGNIINPKAPQGMPGGSQL